MTQDVKKELINEPEISLKNIIENSPDPIVETDLLGNVIYASKQAFLMLGYDPHDNIVGKSVVEWLAPESKSKAIANIANVAKGTPSKDNAYQMIAKDGSLVWAEINASLLFNDLGLPRAILSVVHDITARKKIEDELQLKIDELKSLNNILIGREEKMTELKEEVNSLLKELNRPEKY